MHINSDVLESLVTHTRARAHPLTNTTNDHKFDGEWHMEALFELGVEDLLEDDQNHDAHRAEAQHVQVH